MATKKSDSRKISGKKTSAIEKSKTRQRRDVVSDIPTRSSKTDKKRSSSKKSGRKHNAERKATKAEYKQMKHELRLPSGGLKNPFLRKFDKTNTDVQDGIKWKPKPLTDEQFEQQLKEAKEVKQLVANEYESHGPIFHRAAEMFLPSRNFPGPNPKEVKNRLIDLIIARAGIPSSPMRDRIVPDGYSANQRIKHAEHAESRYRLARQLVVGYFKQSVFELARLLGGPKVFLKYSSSARKRLYKRLLRECPMAVLRHAFTFEHRAIQIEAVFACRDTERHKLWQEFYKIKFLKMCKTAEEEFLPEAESCPKKAGDDELKNAYDSMPNDPKMKALGLPDLDETPSRAFAFGRGYDEIYKLLQIA